MSCKCKTKHLYCILLGTLIASAIPVILYVTNNSTSPPTQFPTYSPTIPTFIPTYHPTPTPSAYPTAAPTSLPSTSPTLSPSSPPTAFPTASPTLEPTLSPTITYIEPPPSYSPTKHVKKKDVLIEATPYILAGIITTVVVGAGGGAFHQYRKNRRQPVIPNVSHIELSEPEQQNASPSPVAQGPKMTPV